MKNVGQFLNINPSDNFFNTLGDGLVAVLKPYEQYSDILQDLKFIPQLILGLLYHSNRFALRIVSLPFMVIECFLRFLDDCIKLPFQYALTYIAESFMTIVKNLIAVTYDLAKAVLVLPIALILLFSKSLSTLFNGPQEASGRMPS